MKKYSIKLVKHNERIFNTDDWEEIVKFSRELCDRDISHYIVDNEFAIKCPMVDAKPWKS